MATASYKTDSASALSSIIEILPPFIFLACFLFAIAILYFGQTVFIPIAFSLLLTFVLSPIVDRLERWRLGRVPAVIVVVIFAISLIVAAGWVLSAQLTKLLGELPQYERNIKEKIVDLREFVKGGALGQVQKSVDEIKQEITDEEKGGEKPREVVVHADRSSTFWPVPLIAGPVVERLAGAALAVILVVFMLLGRDDLRNRLIRLIGYRRITITTKALEDAGKRISRYLLAQLLINSLFGLSVGVGLALIDLPHAPLWGFLAGLLRFIPYVGPWLGASMPSALALAAFQGWPWPLVVIALFVVLELIANLILEPLLYGGSAGISQVALIVSVAFWTWLWGPLGLLMATPLTVCLVVLGKYVPQLHYITVLMSDEPVVEKHVVFYQRLLAMDQTEAADIVIDFLKTHPPEQLYDEIMIPALNLARLDRARDGLSDEQEQFIWQQMRSIIESITKPAADVAAWPNAEIHESETSAAARAPVLGCPARDEADELALLMFQHLVDRSRYTMEIVGAELVSEVIEQVAKNPLGIILIAAVQPGGLAHARYLCKRIRGKFADIKIIVGLWHFRGDAASARESLIGAGADQIGMNLLESRDQLNNVVQLLPNIDLTLENHGVNDRSQTASH
jgi:predicted PurR-regulated permease PerM